MAYNLPMQLNLQAPSVGNIASVKKIIEVGLSDIKVGNFNFASLSKANSQIKQTSQQLDKGQKAATGFFDAVEGKARGFAAYTVASTAILRLVGAVTNATREAFKYDAELLKIAQTTGDTIEATRSYSSTLTDISKKYNVSVSKVAQLTKVLAQTGLGFKEAAKGAEILARTSLLASFDNIADTTEGLISVMNTFGISVERAGSVMEQINAVSKKFAVESGDIVEAIRRSGGAFKSAGGNIVELIALFTSVRATSRESAETISTAFNTIFGRLQRPETIKYFQELGIELETLDGKFVGPQDAVKRITEGLKKLGISAGSVQFAAIAEKIGGIRQIAKVIPLLQQTAVAQEAFTTANEAGVSSIEDIEKAQKGLSYQLGSLGKNFSELMIELTEDNSFRTTVDVFVNISKALIEITRSIKPLLPLFAGLAMIKMGRGITSLLSGGINLKGVKDAASAVSGIPPSVSAATVKPMAMINGGFVPGSGSGDTVPAMLTPGEFVVNKKSAEALGHNNLNKINKEMAFAKALGLGLFDRRDVVHKRPDNGSEHLNTSGDIERDYREKNTGSLINHMEEFEAIVYSTLEKLGKAGEGMRNGPDALKLEEYKNPTNDNARGIYSLQKNMAKVVFGRATESTARHEVGHAVDGRLGGLKVKRDNPNDEGYASQTEGTFQNVMAKKAQENMREYLKRKYPNATEDMQKGFAYRTKITEIFAELFEKSSPEVRNILANTTDAAKGKKQLAKLFAGEPEKYERLYGDAHDAIKNEIVAIKAVKLARGGFVPGSGSGDTVPAMLTPGEFVINKKSSKAIGYGNLRKINKYGRGGAVDGMPSQGFEHTSTESNINTDLKRGTGEVFKTMSEVKKALAHVLSSLGPAGEKLAASVKLASIPASKRTPEGKNIRGQFDSETNTIGMKLGVGTESTLPHETGHAADLQSGGGKKFASEWKGTLQNELAKAAQANIKAALEATGMSEEEVKYRTKLKEIYADLFQKSDPTVRNILANTTDASKGMRQLADLFVAQPEKYQRLYGDSHKALKEQLVYATNTAASAKRIAEAEALAESAAKAKAAAKKVSFWKSATETATVRGSLERMKDPGSELPKSSRAVTSKTVKADAMSGGQGEITKQIADKTQILKGLKGGQAAAEAGWMSLAGNLEKLEAQIAQGIPNQKAQIRAGQLRLELAAKVASAEKQYVDATGQVAAVEEERATLIGKAKGQKNQRTSALVSAGQLFGKIGPATPNIIPPKVLSGFEKLGDYFSKLNVSIPEFILYSQSAASALKQFAGVDINQAALSAGQVSASKFDIASGLAGKFSEKKDVKGVGIKLKDAGKGIKDFGKSLGGKSGALITKAGQVLGKGGLSIAKNAALIAKGAGMLAKGLNLVAWVQLFGGFVDALFSTDFGKQKDKAIELGDANAAAAAAAQEYAQGQWRAVPILGGFLAAISSAAISLGLSKGGIESELDARGKLIVSTARIQASMKGLDKELSESSTSFNQAVISGDTEKSQAAFGRGSSAIEGIRGQADSLRTQASTMKNDPGGSVAGGAIGGAIGGAGVGAVVAGAFSLGIAAPLGAAIGGAIGGIAGGTIAYINSIYDSDEAIGKAYDASSEAYAMAGAANAEQIKQVSSMLTSEATRIIAAGGTTAQAINSVKNKIGKDNFNKLFGGSSLSDAGRAGSVKKLEQEVNAANGEIGDKKREKISTKTGSKEEKAIENDIARIEADKSQSQATLEAIIQLEAAIVQQRALNKERDIEARAIAGQIKLARLWSKALDVIDGKVRRLDNLADDMSKIGTGELTFDDSRKGLGVQASRDTLQMSGDQVLRDEKSFKEMRGSIAQFSAAQGIGSGALNQLDTARNGVKMFEGLETDLSQASGGLTEIARITSSVDADPSQESTTKETKIMNLLIEKLVKTGQIKPGLKKDGVESTGSASLDAALQDYAKALSAGGGSNLVAATEEAKKKISEESKQFIERNQKDITELTQKNQQYRQMQLQLISRQIETANNIYDADIAYGKEVIDLREDTAIFLSKGRGKNADLGIRQNTINQKTALMTTGRQNLVGRLNTPSLSIKTGTPLAPSGVKLTGDVSGDVNKLLTALGGLGSTADEASFGLEASTKSYITAIGDVISVEKDKLQLLKDQATVQRDYTQALRDAQGDLVTEFAFGTDAQRGDLLNTADAASFAAKNGSLDGIPEDMRAAVGSFLDKFSDVALPGAGGRTGAEVKGQIAAQEAVRAGLIEPSQAADFAAKAAKKEVPISQQFAEGIAAQQAAVDALREKEKALKDALMAREVINNNEFGRHVEMFGKNVEVLRDSLMTKLTDTDVQRDFATTDAAANAAGTSSAVDEAEKKLKKAALVADQNQLQAVRARDRSHEMSLEAGRASNDLQFSPDTIMRTTPEQVKEKRKDAQWANDTAVTAEGRAADSLKRHKEAEAELEAAKKADRAANRELDSLRPASGTSLPPTSLASSGPSASGGFASSPRPIEVAVAPSPVERGASPPRPLNQTSPNGAGGQSSTLEVAGQQEVVVRLPDIQAIVSQGITNLVYTTIAETFNKLSEDVRAVNNFDDFANALRDHGVEQRTTKSIA